MHEDARKAYFDYVGAIGFSVCKGSIKLLKDCLFFIGFYVAKRDTLILIGKQ